MAKAPRISRAYPTAGKPTHTLRAEQLRSAALALCERVGRSTDPILQFKLTEEAVAMWTEALRLERLQHERGQS